MFLKTHMLAISGTYGAAEVILAEECMHEACLKWTQAKPVRNSTDSGGGIASGSSSLCSSELLYA